jgi:putative ATP-grasp target RiPP
MPGEWPLRDFIELGALPGAVPCARLHARAVLWEWGLVALSDSTELVLSELVTNAVAASCPLKCIPPVRVWLRADSARVLVSVWDCNPQSPVRIDPSQDDESGRGLLLVEVTSSRWGTRATPQSGGKTVWALIEETGGQNMSGGERTVQGKVESRMPGNGLVRQGDQFPLGAALGVNDETAGAGKTVSPFGLRYVTAPAAGSVVEVDFSEISYDPVRQIAVVADDDGSLLPAMKHTSTTTKTSTASNDRKGSDSDTDYTGR